MLRYYYLTIYSNGVGKLAADIFPGDKEILRHIAACDAKDLKENGHPDHHPSWLLTEHEDGSVSVEVMQRGKE